MIAHDKNRFFEKAISVHINAEYLLEFLQGDEGLLAELATIFVQTLPDVKARLQFSVRSHDPLMLREVTHQLASRLGYFQAMELSDRARNLEQCAMANQLGDASQKVVQLIQGLGELVDELRLLTKLPLKEAEED